MAKEITLEELARSSEKQRNTIEGNSNNITPPPAMGSGIKSARTINTSELAKGLAEQHPEAQKKIIEEDAPLVEEAFASMRKTLEEKKDFIENEMMPIVMENAREMALEKELGEYNEEEVTTEEPVAKKEDDDFAYLDDNIDEGTIREDLEAVSSYNEDKVYEIPKQEDEVRKEKPKEVKREEPENSSSDLDGLMKELGLDDEDDEEDLIDDEEETTEEVRERFKATLTSIKVTRNPIDLSQFQIAKKPVSVSNILNAKVNTTKKRCDWPLFNTGRNMTFEECSGPELDALRKTINNSNGVNGVVASLRFVYNHVVDANKKPFEVWCKSIRTEDIESLYFGMYKACYADTNLLARSDQTGKAACKKTSLISTDINKMVKYESNEVKARFDELMRMDTTDSGDVIKSNIIPISDNIAISYGNPTLYSTFIQYASIKPEITEKYADQLNTMAYIDGFFKIDQDTKTLTPVAIREYPNNINKTVMSKLRVYIDILKTLSNDQYNIMVAKLDNIISEPKVSYIYPEDVCPECGNTLPEEAIQSMLNLLFIRAQLVQVKSL
jgi:hypothetical protein